MPDTEIELIDKINLITELRSANPNKKEIIILDCRSANDYAVSHIKHSANISIPTIMLRRLKEGKIDLFSTIKCKDLKSRILGMNIQTLFVLYHNNPFSAISSPDIIHILSRKLMAEFNDKKIRVVCLAEGFINFQSAFPEMCEDERTNNMQSNTTEQLMGLRSLRISTPLSDSACSSSTESSDGESASNYPLEPYGGEPIEILPGLFLGNAAHSEDIAKIQKYNIRYILNVSTLPNVFQFQDTGIEYLQIAITDHWSQDLSVHFPDAIKFIEEAKAKNVSCLVHCLAGVSRSVTITLAYLMYAKDLSLNDAFTFVRARKPDISPNFHFMEQLYTFERQLKNDPNRRPMTSASSSATTTPSTYEGYTPSSAASSVSSHHLRSNRFMARHDKYSCACNESECKCMQQGDYLLGPVSNIGVSPDSGIEFDLRTQSWTPSASSDNNNTQTPK